MKVIWTRHAEERQKEWEKKRGITRQEVEKVLNKPGQLVAGDRDIRIAQSKVRQGILRVLFREIDADRKVITVYWTSKLEKYWREE